MTRWIRLFGRTAIQKAEIKRIADYLKDLEEGLYEWDYIFKGLVV
jgi:hypothetical protein